MFMLFKSPGPVQIHGHPVEHITVDEAEVEAKKAEGWFMTAVEAGEARLKTIAAAAAAEAERVATEVDEKFAATRDELEQKAAELGVVFDRRIGNKKLTALIQAKLAEPPPALRTDGPTLEEYVAAGYLAENYPPAGYAAKPSASTEPPPASLDPEAPTAQG